MHRRFCRPSFDLYGSRREITQHKGQSGGIPTYGLAAALLSEPLSVRQGPKKNGEFLSVPLLSVLTPEPLVRALVGMLMRRLHQLSN